MSRLCAYRVLIILVVALICGAIGAAIGQKKNFGAVGPFFVGALLGIIGIGMLAILKPNLPRAPAGMRAVKCPRCNAVQNIPRDSTSYDCWQCHLSVDVKPVLALTRKKPRAQTSNAIGRHELCCFTA